ncbi:hypothetical protein Bbelb_362870 [Branchiostoma belcheri]|nr:hypothetical protein Bbelb_362870 [Branchiostoma belcheri]
MDATGPSPSGFVTFETAPVRHVFGVDAGRRHDAERAPYWTRLVPGQSPVLTRAACGRVPTGSYSSAGQLSGPWRVPGGIPTGSSRVFEQAGACSAARRVPGSEVTASLRRISPNGARSVFNSELKSIRRPRGAKNRPAAVGKPAGLRPGADRTPGHILPCLRMNLLDCTVALYVPSHGRRRRGRQPTSYFKYVQQLLGDEHNQLTEKQIANLACDKGQWRDLLYRYSRYNRPSA